MPEKPMLDDEPREEYQMGLWLFEKEIRNILYI